MIKRLAIILMCSLLLSGAVVETAQAAHGIWPINYCPGNPQPMGENNLNSWTYWHVEATGETCNVYGWIDRTFNYCPECREKLNVTTYKRERHVFGNIIYLDEDIVRSV